MDVRDAVAGLKPVQKAAKGKKARTPVVDPDQSFDDFTNADGNYVAVQYRGNVVLPLVVSRSDMQRIEEAMNQ